MSSWGTSLPVELTAEDNILLENWYKLQSQLKLVKDSEMELRKAVVVRFFKEDDREGTMRYALPDGYKLKVVKKQNYKLKNENGETDKVLVNVSEDLAALLVKWTPTLSVSTFKKLAPEFQSLFNDCLEITDGSPTLEIEESKPK